MSGSNENDNRVGMPVANIQLGQSDPSLGPRGRPSKDFMDIAEGSTTLLNEAVMLLQENEWRVEALQEVMQKVRRSFEAVLEAIIGADPHHFAGRDYD